MWPETIIRLRSSDCDYVNIQKPKTNPKEEPMSDNRKYYYLKLKENFYNSETMVILESMQDGLLYSNLLLKMYLMSLKSGGILMLNDHLPHTPQTIATFTRHQVGTVERALKVFLEFGLVEILTDGAYYMADIQLLIGQSSTEGERKKKERMRLKRQKLAVFVPFVTQELFMSGDAMYYGLNALSNNMVLLDRKQSRCPNGLVFGTPGSGKSMSCKREITFIMLMTQDNVIICDPEDEYSPLVKRLGGQVIRLSPSSTDYVNPLDINLNYSEEENPLALKSDFVLSFCELIMGSKTGLEAIEKTVIDRAVQMIYQPYFADPRPENMPILGDLMNALLSQHIPEADRVAQALDLYVNGSLNFFNHRTTVDISNRLVCFDIKGLGKNLKKPGMLIVQDAVWNTVTINRAIGRSTWYFVDEFHLLLKEEQTAAYSAEIWKRFRKWGGVPTGATQNPKDLLSSPEIENILENSDFIYLLNLSAGDRKLMTERLNISAEQLAYVTNADPGSGLLFFQNVILPFRDEFPKDTELYKLLTTKPSEVAHDGESR